MLHSIPCVNCANDISYDPDDFKSNDNPAVRCDKCGQTTPLTEADLQTPEDLE
jgi:hypothetical protein